MVFVKGDIITLFVLSFFSFCFVSLSFFFSFFFLFFFSLFCS